MKYFIAAITLMLSAEFVFAQSETVLIGPGTASCTKYLESRTQNKELTKLVFESWFRGYLSGRNAQLRELTYKQLDLAYANDKIGEVVAIACNNAVKQGYGDLDLWLVIDKIFGSAFDEKTHGQK